MERLGETVRTVLRRAAARAAPRPAGRRSSRRGRAPHRAAAAGARRRRHGSARRGVRGAPDVRERRGDQRGDARHVGISVARNARAGRPLRPPSAPPLADVHGRVGAVARRSASAPRPACSASPTPCCFASCRCKSPDELVVLQWISGPVRAVREPVRATAPSIEHAVHRARRSPCRPSKRCAPRPRRYADIFGFAELSGVNLSSDGRAEIAGAQLVSGNYFDVLGVPPAAGRPLVRGRRSAGRAARRGDQRRVTGSGASRGRPTRSASRSSSTASR